LAGGGGDIVRIRSDGKAHKLGLGEWVDGENAIGGERSGGL